MFCSVKTDEGNDAALHLSLRSPNVHLRTPSGKFPSDPCSTLWKLIRRV